MTATRRTETGDGHDRKDGPTTADRMTSEDASTGGAGRRDPGPLEARVAALERTVAAMSQELRTRRLVVLDAGGAPRHVAEVAGATAELRVAATDATRPGAPAVVLHASAGRAGTTDPGPLTGLQLWAGGDALVEVDAWPDVDGGWRPHLHIGGPG